MPILEVEHISKSFNKTPVLKDVGFNLEKGQAVLPVPRVKHPLKRYKYEFLPHAMPALRSSCLTQQPFLAVPTEFENRFLCLLHFSLCVVK